MVCAHCRRNFTPMRRRRDQRFCAGACRTAWHQEERIREVATLRHALDEALAGWLDATERLDPLQASPNREAIDRLRAVLDRAESATHRD